MRGAVFAWDWCGGLGHLFFLFGGALLSAATPTIRRTALAMYSPQGCERSPKSAACPALPGEIFLRQRLGVRPRNIPREKQTPIVFQTDPSTPRASFARTQYVEVGFLKLGGGPERGRWHGQVSCRDIGVSQSNNPVGLTHCQNRRLAF
eukprot:3218485-Amphidinium_carterae.1